MAFTQSCVFSGAFWSNTSSSVGTGPVSASGIGGNATIPRWSGGDTDRLDAHLRERYDAAVVPGRWFEMPDHFRVGFGMPNDDFAEGLTRLGAALDDLQ